jgi:hypothetical protein
MSGPASGPSGAWGATAIGWLLRSLAAQLRADSGYPASEAVPYLRESAGQLALLGIGDPERLNLIGSRCAVAPAVPASADLDSLCVNQQISELEPGWFS